MRNAGLIWCVAAVGGLAFAASSWGQEPTCMSLPCATEKLATTLEQDWRTLDEDGFERLWPGVLAANRRYALAVSNAHGGRLVVSEATRLCCTESEVCLLPNFGEQGLFILTIHVCSANPDGVAQLVEEAAPGNVAEVDPASEGAPAGPRGRPDKVLRWTDDNQTMELAMHMPPEPDEEPGVVELARCFGATPFETWTGESGRRFQVALPKLTSRKPRNVLNGAFHVSLRPDCSVGDAECVKKELVALWPLVQARAERVGAKEVSLGFLGCQSLSIRSIYRDEVGGAWNTCNVDDSCPRPGE